jgi:hypothetical protein
MRTKLLLKTPKGRDHSEKQGLDWRIILKSILRYRVGGCDPN